MYCRFYIKHTYFRILFSRMRTYIKKKWGEIPHDIMIRTLNTVSNEGKMIWIKTTVPYLRMLVEFFVYFVWSMTRYIHSLLFISYWILYWINLPQCMVELAPVRGKLNHLTWVHFNAYFSEAIYHILYPKYCVSRQDYVLTHHPTVAFPCFEMSLRFQFFWKMVQLAPVSPTCYCYALVM